MRVDRGDKFSSLLVHVDIFLGITRNPVICRPARAEHHNACRNIVFRRRELPCDVRAVFYRQYTDPPDVIQTSQETKSIFFDGDPFVPTRFFRAVIHVVHRSAARFVIGIKNVFRIYGIMLATFPSTVQIDGQNGIAEFHVFVDRVVIETFGDIGNKQHGVVLVPVVRNDERSVNANPALFRLSAGKAIFAVINRVVSHLAQLRRLKGKVGVEPVPQGYGGIKFRKLNHRHSCDVGQRSRPGRFYAV